MTPYKNNFETGQSFPVALREPLRPHRTKLAVANSCNFDMQPDCEPVVISAEDWRIVMEGLQISSSSFVSKVISQAPAAATRLFDTSSTTPSQLIKTVFSHRDLGRRKTGIIADHAAMNMIDVALESDNSEIPLYCTGFPMKVYNPLETHYGSDDIDLGDVSVLLRFAELTKALNHFAPDGKSFLTRIISDGVMNNGMFQADPKVCTSYVNKLNALSKELDVASHVQVREFFDLLSEDSQAKSEYEILIANIRSKCHDQFDDLLMGDSLEQSIAAAVAYEEQAYGTTAFRDIFNSTIGSTRYREIEQFSEEFNLSLPHIYAMVLESILWERDIRTTATYAKIGEIIPPSGISEFDARLEETKKSALKQAWHGTIEYLAVLRANSQFNVLSQLHPGGIRLTTRPKLGQIGIHTSDQANPSLFSYHSVPVVRPCNKDKNVKIDFELLIDATRNARRPVQNENGSTLFYLHPEIDPSSNTIKKLPWLRGSK